MVTFLRDRRPAELQAEIVELAHTLGVAKIGFADLVPARHQLVEGYSIGISLLKPMRADLVGSTVEEHFHQHQMAQREDLEALKADLGAFIASRGYRWHSVGNDMDPDRLLGELSHKPTWPGLAGSVNRRFSSRPSSARESG